MSSTTMQSETFSTLVVSEKIAALKVFAIPDNHTASWLASQPAQNWQLHTHIFHASKKKKIQMQITYNWTLKLVAQRRPKTN